MNDAPAGLHEFLLADNTPAPTPGEAAPAAPSEVPAGLEQFVGPEMLEEEYGGPTGALTAGAAHVVSSALPGVGVKLMQSMGVSPEEYQKLTQANPVASSVGDVLAFAKGAGATKAITGIGKGVGALAPVGSVLGRSLQLGTEGALIGLSNAANEAALGDPNLNAQKLFSDVGLNTAIGLALGPISKGIEVALPAAGKKLSSTLNNLKEDVFGTIEEPSSISKAMGKVGSAVSDHTPTAWTDAFINGMNAEDTKLTAPKLVKNLSALSEASEKAAVDLEDSIFKTAMPATAAEESAFDLISSHRMAAKEFESMFMKGGTIDTKKIEALAKGLESPEHAVVAREVLDNFVNSAKAISDATENLAAYKEAEKSISSHIKSLAKEHADVREAIEAMGAAPSEAGGHSLMSDIGAGSIAHMVGVPHPAIAAGVGMMRAYEAVQNPFTSGKALKRAFDVLKAIGNVAEKTSDKMDTLSKAVFANPAARRIPMGGFEAPMIAVPAENGKRSHDSQIARVQELMTHPDKLQDHLAKQTEEFYDIAPQVSMGLHNTVMRAVQFLDSKIPRPPQQMMLSSKWQPSNSQKQKFATYLAAIDSPLSVLKKVKDGSLTTESIEALQAVMPEMLNEMRSRVSENLNPKKAEKLSYPTKIALGKFLGQPLVEGMLPQVIMSNQISLSGPQQSQQDGKKSPRTTVGGLKELDIARRSETESQDHGLEAE